MTGNLVLVRTRRQYTLASTFLRFQEHYESPKFRGKIFSLEEFMDWYALKFGNFTYYQNWSGFNIPSSVLKPFREGRFNPLSRKEKRLLDLLVNMPEPFYVVGTYGTRIDLPTLKHELTHGLYHTVPEYRKRVRRILRPKKIRRFTEILKKTGYHPSVWQDETNAYLLTTVACLKDDGFRWTPSLRNLQTELRETFETRFGFSLHRAGEDNILSFFHQTDLDQGGSNAQIGVRRVRPDEMGLLCELDVKIFGSDAFDSPEDWEGLKIFFITKDQQIIGSIALRHNTDVAEHYSADYKELPSSLYIVSTALLPEWQGRGIGKKAKAWQVRYAKSRGFERIVTNARVSNVRSISLNQHFGFKALRVIPAWYYEPEEDTLVLERKL